MSKKFLLVIFSLVLFLNSHTVFAGVVINEVQLYPTGERFIELYNQDSSEIDLTDWYIQRKTQTGTSFTSLVSKTNFLNKKINPNGYFLISRSAMENADIVLSTLTLTESNIIQIKNGAGEVVNSLCFGDVADCTPSVSNPGEGQSIGRDQNGVFIIGARSPRAPNQIISESPVFDTNVNSSESTETTSSVASASGGTSQNTPKIEEKSLTTKIKTKTGSFLSLPLTFEVKSYGIHGEELSTGKYFWNFGDGTTEERTDNKNFTHTYSYAGEYLVSVEYFVNSYSNVPDVLNKIKIKVVPIELSVSRTGDMSDFFVEILNNSTYDIDISSWKLSADGKVFTFPRNTNILAKKKIILSPNVTYFTILDKNNLKLFTPDDTIVNPSTNEIKIVEPIMMLNEGNPVRSEGSQRPPTSNETRENLLASASSAPVLAENIDKNEVKNTNSYIFIIILFIFLLVSGGVVYFLRRDGVPLTNSSDFEILDE